MFKKGYKMSQSHKDKIGKANRGKKKSLDARKKLSERFLKNPVRFWLGKKRPDFSNSQLGEKNHQWKGNKVGYTALHQWLYKRLGQPKMCGHCGKSDALRYEWANISGKYLRDVKDWIRLCKKCHCAFDRKAK